MSQSQHMGVGSLGAAAVTSPLKLSTGYGDGIGDFVPEGARICYRVAVGTTQDVPDWTFEKAGPRQQIFFRPADTRAALVTCGGLCPGINNIIRSVTLELFHNYGVARVLGLRFGYEGLVPAKAQAPIELTPDVVEDIHREGGTILGSSRGEQDIGSMVNFLADARINLLFCVGGDGTQHGAHRIAQEIGRRGLSIAVVGIPKTIDNDILYVQRTFGYATAIDETRKVLDCAHAEAKGVWNGIGLVRVMGRDSGFIAAGAALASQEANFALIPEVRLDMDGERGFLNVLRGRMLARHHAVIIVAEGAGQRLLAASPQTDASGNRIHEDIGLFLKERIRRYFAQQSMAAKVCYIDPSYIVRSVPANSEDSLLCDRYARHAVHAGMAGKTDVLIGLWNEQVIHVPLAMAIASRQELEPEGELWEAVISATGQPRKWS